MSKLLVLVDDENPFKVCAFPGRGKSGFEEMYDSLSSTEQDDVDYVIEVLAKKGTEINRFVSRSNPISVPAKRYKGLWELRPKEHGRVRIGYFLRNRQPPIEKKPVKKGDLLRIERTKPEIILTHIFFKPKPKVQDAEFDRMDTIRARILHEDWTA